MSQPQRVRGGDMYPASATGDHQEARRERDKIVEQAAGQEQRGGVGVLHVTETDLPEGRRMVTSSVDGQVLSQFTMPVPDRNVAEDSDAVTVGEALQAAAHTSAGDKPVGHADAAALQAAEMRATGLGGNLPGGVAAAAQQAAEKNVRAEGGKVVTIRDVVGDAEAVLPANKAATREDAEKAAAAAARNEGKKEAAAGVVDALAAAADMNKPKKRGK
ncbi:hypothetical protein HU200_039005 [Digitaria exilis]|uniref:SMP domain-containing protein n=1 Tax=Digitaria exilis TaxID=1010633 RepID=A0A835BC72_9POAL|nr:hypothetical protein HU200_039005 [Digitaria exilis]